MKHIIITSPLLLLLLSISLFFANCANNEFSPPLMDHVNKELSTSEMISRGKYLVNIGGCNHCHTPKKMTAQGPELDSALLLSGFNGGRTWPSVDKSALKPGYWVLFASDLTASVGPWGMSFSSNLTPDSATGIGTWTVDDFIKTLRTGRHLGQMGGRPILPPMPWQDLGQLNDEDLHSIFVFLKAIPAVNNRVPTNKSPDELAKMD